MSSIRPYFILDGCFSSVYNYHFVFLNHFHHKKRISLPSYLAKSLLRSLNARRKKASRPILHEGLILLIAENYKAHTPMASMSTVKGKRRLNDIALEVGPRKKGRKGSIPGKAKRCPWCRSILCARAILYHPKNISISSFVFSIRATPVQSCYL